MSLEENAVTTRSSLGKSVKGKRFSQDNKFYGEILAVNDSIKSDRAIKDMLNSGRIPVVRIVGKLNSANGCMFPPLQPYDGPLERKNTTDVDFDSSSAANSAYSTNNNSIGTTLSQAKGSSADASTVYEKAQEKEVLQQRAISEAFNWLQRARSRVDPATCYYEAAKLFNAQQMCDDFMFDSI